MSTQFLLEQLGVGVAAITGVLAARGKNVDLFGVIVLALATAVGGGTVRDLVLDVPVFWIEDSKFLINAALVAVVTFYFVRFKELPLKALLFADAFVLAFFTMVGTRKALVFEADPAVAVAMGVITGVVGGIIRDTLTGEIPLVFRREIYLYATAAFFGASVFVGLYQYGPHPLRNLILGSAVTLVIRLAGIRWKIALPLFRPRNQSDEPLMTPPSPS